MRNVVRKEDLESVSCMDDVINWESQEWLGFFDLITNQSHLPLTEEP